MVGMEVGADDAGDARIAQRAGIERLPRVRAEGQADAGVDDRDAVPAVSGRIVEQPAIDVTERTRHRDARPAYPIGNADRLARPRRSEEHTSELQSLMRISYAVFCLKKKK